LLLQHQVLLLLLLMFMLLFSLFQRQLALFASGAFLDSDRASVVAVSGVEVVPL
jgi:hypothetical protein